MRKKERKLSVSQASVVTILEFLTSIYFVSVMLCNIVSMPVSGVRLMYVGTAAVCVYQTAVREKRGQLVLIVWKMSI